MIICFIICIFSLFANNDKYLKKKTNHSSLFEPYQVFSIFSHIQVISLSELCCFGGGLACPQSVRAHARTCTHVREHDPTLMFYWNPECLVRVQYRGTCQQGSPNDRRYWQSLTPFQADVTVRCRLRPGPKTGSPRSGAILQSARHIIDNCYNPAIWQHLDGWSAMQQLRQWRQGSHPGGGKHGLFQENKKPWETSESVSVAGRFGPAAPTMCTNSSYVTAVVFR